MRHLADHLWMASRVHYGILAIYPADPEFELPWRLGGGVEPPVHVYRRSFLSENRFKISISVQNFKHLTSDPPVLLGQFQHWADLLINNHLQCFSVDFLRLLAYMTAFSLAFRL